MQRSRNPLINTLLISAAAVLAATPLSTPAHADSFAQYEPGFIRQANRALARNDAPQALKILDANRDRDVKRQHRAEALGIACRAHLKLDDATSAKEACESATAISGGRSSWRHHNNLGVAELTLGNYTAAEQAFVTAATLNAWAKAPRQNLGLVHEIREVRENASGDRVANTNSR